MGGEVGGEGGEVVGEVDLQDEAELVHEGQAGGEQVLGGKGLEQVAAVGECLFLAQLAFVHVLYPEV